MIGIQTGSLFMFWHVCCYYHMIFSRINSKALAGKSWHIQPKPCHVPLHIFLFPCSSGPEPESSIAQCTLITSGEVFESVWSGLVLSLWKTGRDISWFQLLNCSVPPSCFFSVLQNLTGMGSITIIPIRI